VAGRSPPDYGGVERPTRPTKNLKQREAARKAARRGEVQGPTKPMDAAHNLWIGLDVSTKGMRDLGSVHKGVSPGVIVLPSKSCMRASKFK